MKPFIEMTPSGEVWSAVDPEPPARGAPLAPLLAGARARGVADGFEWLGLAAILLDDRGEVLHVNRRAVDLMGEDLFLSSGRLRARDAEIDGALGVAIRRALMGGTSSNIAIPSCAEKNGNIVSLGDSLPISGIRNESVCGCLGIAS